ncbi:WXG100 family type VII secretion target [Streptomyces sp. H27-D2]|uniref:WXG100 family type VII secretion target n=1 Tax=Streptomyces sp. H27-D2 TaxID=3046304 RepID=UPI002DB6CD75|nr:WXG100 family type VII secretion target [Streptomyces sp. H27-D2]MEC4020548.1 WXG100 family type VII secretion target [Streptomyces sp. H27-D2]
MGNEKLAVSDSELASLINDLDGMQSYLKTKIKRLNSLVDAIETGWKGPAAAAYRDLQRGVNADAVQVREMLILIEEAVKMSRDGFNAEELEQLRTFRSLQNSLDGQQQILGMADANPEPAPAPPRSRIDDF